MMRVRVGADARLPVSERLVPLGAPDGRRVAVERDVQPIVALEESALLNIGEELVVLLRPIVPHAGAREGQQPSANARASPWSKPENGVSSGSCGMVWSV